MYPGIVLGNGATVKKKEYLKKIGEYDDTEERILKKDISQTKVNLGSDLWVVTNCRMLLRLD